MKKISYLLLWASICLIPQFANARITQVAETGNLYSTILSSLDNDTIELTTSGGAYTVSSDLNFSTEKSLTIRAASGLAIRPIVTKTAGSYFVRYYPTTGSLTETLTFDGIDFVGGASTLYFLYARCPSLTSNLNVVMNNCVVRNMSSISSRVFNYLGTAGTTPAVYGDLIVTNSEFRNIGGNIINSTILYSSPNNASFTNCLFVGPSNSTSAQIRMSATGYNSFVMDHCTFTNARANELYFVSGTGTCSVTNTIFANSTNVSYNNYFGSTTPITLGSDCGVYYIAGGQIQKTNIYPRSTAAIATDPLLDATTGVATAAAYMTAGTDGKRIGYSLDPTITLSKSVLSDLSYTKSSGPSTAQAFNVKGSKLLADIVITPPTNYEISTTVSSGFVSTPITLSQSGGTISNTTIYVRLKSALADFTYTGDIILSSTGAISSTIALSGTVMNNPTIIMTPTTLTGFRYTIGGGPSTEQSFSVNGVNLTGGLTITAPSNYEISAVSGASFSPTSSISIAQSGGIVSPTTIYVRLKSGLSVSAYNQNVTLTSTGATTKLVACVGKVTNPPAVNASLSSLSGFTYFLGSGPSTAKNFKVSGNDLTAGVTITPPYGYEISTNLGSTYTASAVTLGLTNSDLADSTIYVRLQAGYSVSSYYGNISVASSGVTSKTIALTGNVVNVPAITTSTSSLTGFNYFANNGPSAIQSITVSGSYLVDTLVVTAPANYEISQTGGASFVAKTVLKYPQTAGIVSTTTIYVRLKSGLLANTYAGNIVATTTSGIANNIALSGTITNLPTITTSTTNLTGLNYIVANGPSAEQSFVVSGNYLTSILLINAPTHYEISTSTGVAFSPSNQILLTQSGGVAGPTTIYVRLKAGLISNTYTDSITVTSTNAVSKKVYFTGIVSIPTLTVSKTTLTLTKYIVSNGPSAALSFDVSGMNLSGNVTITAPTNFEISKLPTSAFTSSVVLTQVGNSVTNTTIYVRLIKALSVAEYSGNISITSTGATSKTIALAGKVVNPPTISQAMGGFDYNLGNGPSAENIIVLDGADLESGVIVTPSANFEISNISSADGGVFSNLPLTIPQALGYVNTSKIFVRMKSGLPFGIYSNNLLIQSTGATAISIPLRGEVKLPIGASFVNAKNSIRVTTTPSNIKVSGTNSGDTIEVYSIKGDKVNTVKANDGETNIKTTGRNVYVVKVITKE